MNKIDKILQDHEERINALEKLVSKPQSLVAKKQKKTLSDHIIGLRENGFFKDAKTADETHKKLTNVYRCDLNRVAVALIRLADGKLLRRTTKVIGEKKYKAYVW